MGIAATADDPRTWTKSDLLRYVGGLSNPSKMPGFGYSLPARECTTGSTLRLIPGSTCSICYALKGRYSFGKVKNALYRRLESITAPLWPQAMAELIHRTKDGYFRWHDSGDLQSVEHLERIAEVCHATPGVSHWLPTREYRLVQDFMLKNELPENLNIRLSAHMIDGKAPQIIGLTASTVSTKGTPEGSHSCPAPTQDNKCGSCRACWDRTIPIVDYHAH